MHDSAATSSAPPVDELDGAPGDGAGADDDYYDYDVAPARGMPRTTLALLMGVLIAIGFAGGVLAQKRHDKGLASSASTLPAGFPAGGFGGPGGGAGTGAGPGSDRTGGAATTGTRGTASGPVLVGTVVSVAGTTITVKDLGGATHTVSTTDTTTLTKQQRLKLTDLTAGQTVSVNGTKADDGKVTATAVTIR